MLCQVSALAIKKLFWMNELGFSFRSRAPPWLRPPACLPGLQGLCERRRIWLLTSAGYGAPNFMIIVKGLQARLLFRDKGPAGSYSLEGSLETDGSMN